MKNQVMAWQSRAEAANRFFEDGDYELALSCYEATLKTLETLAREEKAVIAKGDKVQYLANVDAGEWKTVVVQEVCMDDAGGPEAEPYYTIQFEDQEDNKMIEKQTTTDRLAGSYFNNNNKKQEFLGKLVECHLLLGGDDHIEPAVEIAKQSIAIDEKWDKGHFLLAQALLTSGSDAGLEVCAALDQCLTVNPEHEAAKKLLSEQWKSAVPKETKVAPLGNWQANRDAAEQHYREGNYEIALAYWQKTLCNNTFQARPPSETPSILCGIVKCRLMLGGSKNAEAAIAEAKQCIALKERNGTAYLCLAKAYLALDEDKHRDKAIDALEKSLHYNPNLTEAQQILVRQVRSHHRDANEAITKEKTAEEPVAHDQFLKEDDEEEHKGVLRRLLAEVAVTFGLDVLHRDLMFAYRRQPKEIQILIKIILLILGLRVAALVFQFVCWLLFLPVTILGATAALIAPELAGGGLLTMLVIGGIAYLCHKNNINPFLALMALNIADGNRRGNNRDMLMAAGVYEMVKDGDRRPQDRVHRDPYYRGPYYRPYRWYDWHYWW